MNSLHVRLFLLLSLHLTVYAFDNPAYENALKAYQHNDFQSAYGTFETLSKDAPEDAEIHFLVGRCALELHRYDEAMAAFDRVLMLNPHHARTHLEMARLYYEQNHLESTRMELDLLLREQLPNDIRNLAFSFKQKIDDSLSPHRFSGALMIGGGYDSNANNDIGNFEFTLPSLDLPLSGNAKEKDGYLFSTVILNHNYEAKDITGLSLENSFIAYDKLYAHAKQNNLVLFSLSSTPTWSEKEIKIGMPMSFDRVYIDGKGYLYNASVGVKNSYLLDASSMLEGGYTFKKGYYHEKTHNVNTHLIFASYRRTMGDNLFSLALNTNYAINQEVKTVRSDVEYNELKCGVELSKELTKEVKGTLGYTRANARYQDVDSAFLTKRKDDIDLYEASVHYTLQKDLFLSASLSYSDHHSNHAPYDYDKLNTLATLMWTF